MQVFLATWLAAQLAGSPVHAVESVGLLNDTGQFQCYAPNFSLVPCDEAGAGDTSPLPRQDARHGRDAAAAMDRLTKTGGGDHGFDLTRICMNGEPEGVGNCPLSPAIPQDLEHPAPDEWACVRDNVTGLTYTLGNPVRVEWQQVSSTDEGSFIHTANMEARCGLDSGWRIPTRREIYSLTHLGRRPAVDPNYFPILANTPSDGGSPSYWSSDVNAQRPTLNHVVLFGVEAGGLVAGQCRETVPGDLLCGELIGAGWFSRVLLVNGEWAPMTWPDPDKPRGERWEIREDGQVVTDLATGLTWDRCSWGQTSAECDGEGIVFLVWQDAMQVPAFANQQRYKGYYDWRVPNVRELESIIKIDAFNPAIDISVFPNTIPNYYWTSSSTWLAVPTAGNRVWGVTFFNAVVGLERKVPSAAQPTPERSRVRLVRGGQPWSAFDSVSEVLFVADFEGSP